MSEHLPECWAKHESDPPAWCICDELRACEERVATAFNQVWERFSRDQFDAGYAASVVAAVQRVEALKWDYIHSCGELITRARTIAAIKNEVK